MGEQIQTPWVIKNVLPRLSELPECADRAALLEEFWAFWLKYRETCVAVVDTPYPVESGLFRTCVEKNIAERQLLAPFPLIDVASALFACGIDPHCDRIAFSGTLGDAHNPLTDAIASCRCLLKILRE